ncbi:uncharacterized protein PGTG_07799 [Puccinia graminis f. sp. tritici CRL 75-36-700-3]|uniref:Uncharacterized protein n=1 Tax=Puccinia graminis f. sp. tritici (strain CRL 75-36-700-3 / race SCCL) TaxID=418459 RepID=E3KB07_PUCGT|nr:uncharacterized protein PGTG_07799 [Puccinia graminis f. sp. tritici CRL 75-36-700-3]EFP81550.1 hypothetical protein PGTG_07799 [Puccinia graminis f. sp. tritici CRL 75-36-700-3]
MSHLNDPDGGIPDSDTAQTTELNARVRHEKEAHGIGNCPSNIRANDRGHYLRNSMRRKWLPEAHPGANSFGRLNEDDRSNSDHNALRTHCDGKHSTEAPSVPVPLTPENSLRLSSSGRSHSHEDSTVHTSTTDSRTPPGSPGSQGTTRAPLPSAVSSESDPTGVIDPGADDYKLRQATSNAISVSLGDAKSLTLLATPGAKLRKKVYKCG